MPAPELSNSIYLKKVKITFPANVTTSDVGFLAERVSLCQAANKRWHCTFFMVMAPAVLIQVYIDASDNVKTMELLDTEDGRRYLIDGIKLMSVGVSAAASEMRVVDHFILDVGDVTFVEKVEPVTKEAVKCPEQP